jgi:hypothetical protein
MPMLKKALTDTWSFFKDHVIAISLIVLPIVVPIEILNYLFQINSLAHGTSIIYEYIIPWLVGALAEPIYAVAVIYYIASVFSGEKTDTKTLWRLGIKYWLPYGILYFLIALVVIPGYILFIVPGIILFSKYSFAGFDLLLNKSKPTEAMRSSWHLTNTYTWVIIKGCIVITVPLCISYYLLILLLGITGIQENLINSFLQIIYSDLLVLYTIFLFHIYNLARSQQQASTE